MAEQPIILDNPTLWAGVNNEQVKGDDLYQNKLAVRKGRFGQQILNYRSTAEYPITPDELTRFLQKNIAQNSTVNTTQTPATSFDLKAFITANKVPIVIGLGILGYMFFSGGLSASDRTVTSVTRFGRNK